jgi:hypothetical protein
MRYAAVALVLAAGIYHAAHFATVNDDAFISFRYAEQLLGGNGLVYNPGERVEGYTNFLWTVLLAAGMYLGLDPVAWSIAMGICFTAGTLLLAWRVPWLTAGRPPALFSIVPLAALSLALHRDFGVYSTSGLETPMQTFLVTLLFAVLVRGTDARAFLLAGLVLTAALMTRPDAAVFGAAVVTFILLERTRVAARLSCLAVPLLVLFVPYWLIRWSYYGFFFPNAFYAKSIDMPYYGQGLTYVWLYFSSYYPLLLLVPLAVYHRFGDRGPQAAGAQAAGAANGDHSDAGGEGATERRAILLGLLFVVGFTLFVVRIGGDFMFARFLIVVTPVAYILLELYIRRVSPARFACLLAAVLAAGTALRYDHFTASSQVGYIADEWQRYPLASLAGTKRSGAVLRKYFDGLPVEAAFWGGQARLMFYARPYRAIETMTGLTDTFIAHLPIAERGRPGHEKTAPDEYLVRRGVDFSFRPVPPPPPGTSSLNLIVFDSLVARIVTYRNAVMDSLRKYPGVRFVPMPEYLDRYIAEMEGKNPGEVSSDYAWFREYYFRHNRDGVREGALTGYLARNGLPVPSD